VVAAFPCSARAPKGACGVGARNLCM